MERWGATVACFAVTLLVASVTVWSSSTREPESAFDEGGNAASALVRDAQAQGLTVLRLLSGPLALEVGPRMEPDKVLLAIIGAKRPFSAEEIDATRRFLNDGGRLLLAEDFGHANGLSGTLGLVFERVRLVEPEAMDWVPIDLEARHLTVRLASPTALRLDPQIPHRVLAVSSASSFLDRDGDGVISAGDPRGPFPVMAEFPVGNKGGRVVAVADTSPFLEEGAEAADNRKFREYLLKSLLPAGGGLVVDESRVPSRDPWLVAAGSAAGAMTTRPWSYALGALAVAIFALGTMAAARDGWGPHQFSASYFVRRADLLGDAERSADSRRATPARDGAWSRWTGRGRAAVFGGLALAVLGVASGSLQATYAASFLLVAAAFSVLTPEPRIAARHELSAHEVPEEGEIRVNLALENRGRHRTDVEILDHVPREFAVAGGSNWFQTSVGRHAVAPATYQARAALRGPYSIGPVRTRTMDAFRLRMVETSAGAPNPVLVHPQGEPLGQVPFKSKIPLITLGPHLVSRSGDGSEFHSLRDYQAGDSIRTVNWKASARSKDLMVNQRVHESMATVTIFLDVRAVSGAGPVRGSPINQACRAALTIATAAIHARDRVRVFAYGGGVREVATNLPGMQVQDLTRALAELKASGATPFGEALEQHLASIKSRSPFVLISGFEGDPSVVDGLREVRRRGALAVALALPIGTQPEDPAEGEPEAEAETLQTQHSELVSRLRSEGVPVVPAVPGMPLSLLFRFGGPLA